MLSHFRLSFTRFGPGKENGERNMENGGNAGKYVGILYDKVQVNSIWWKSNCTSQVFQIGLASERGKVIKNEHDNPLSHQTDSDALDKRMIGKSEK